MLLNDAIRHAGRQRYHHGLRAAKPTGPGLQRSVGDASR